MLRMFFRRIRPGQLIVLVFLGIILLGAGLLCLPAAARSGRPTPFLTSLFTATSATCVTGLIRVDTGTHWTMFGQVVILLLIQVGGLGFMTIACLFFFALRRRIGLRQRMVLAQALGSDTYSGIVSLVRNILRGTAAVEGVGALILFFRFLPEFGIGRALWYGVFHSVSAFCNAGFDVLADVDAGGSLCRYVTDPVVNFTIMALIIIGGLGFAVWGDIRHHRRFSRLSVYSRLVVIITTVLIFGGAYALIMGAIAPKGGSIKLNQLVNTPKEFQDKELNVLVTGVDRSSTGDLSAGAANDSNVNDGMTDMILYVHFNNETGELKMLQIPRDTMVTTDASVSGNYRINGVAKTQGSDNNNNMAALCELVADQYKIPIDGYITIRLEMLTELVDLFGGVEINVPVDVDYSAIGQGSSVIHAGYQTLDGAAMEFLLRARKVYPDGDIGRLNMQRQFYAALFRKLKSIGNIWDVARLTPAVLNYMETDLNASTLISFAVSMLKIDSNKIMIAQMPVISGPQYQGQALLYPARQEDADLLNQYFRENTGPVDASQLNLCDNVIDLSGYSATDPNIQVMGGLMSEADDAQKNNNRDGSNQVTDVMENDSATTTSESESTSEPAA